jgi:hypothetical protein
LIGEELPAVTGLDARAAQPVDRDTGHARGEARQQRPETRDVAVVLAGLVGVAEDDVVQGRRVHAIPVDDRPHYDGGEVVRAHPSEALAVAPERRADGIVDVAGEHAWTPSVASEVFENMASPRATADRYCG